MHCTDILHHPSKKNRWETPMTLYIRLPRLPFKNIHHENFGDASQRRPPYTAKERFCLEEQTTFVATHKVSFPPTVPQQPPLHQTHPENATTSAPNSPTTAVSARLEDQRPPAAPMQVSFGSQMSALPQCPSSHVRSV